MSKIRFGLIGSGWRAEFYIRIAKALPEMFDLAAVMIRSKEKGEAFSEKFDVKVVNTLDELVEKEPEFVVMAIKRGIVTENLITLFKRGIPVLTETPPGEDVEALQQLWDAYQEYQPKVQVAEQYFLQPLYASWYKAICDGKLGEVENINISSLQLIPMTMIAYRAQYGSANPAAVTGPALLATSASTLAAVVFCAVKMRGTGTRENQV